MTDATQHEPERPGATVFLGDSLIGEGDWESRFPELDVVNMGRPGDTTALVHDRVDEVVAANPSTVVLMIGTNDAGARATVEQIVRGIEDTLFRLHHDLPSARIIVLSVLPREKERGELLHQVNIHVRQFAPTLKAEFVDLWPVFADEHLELKPDYSDDRLHLNDAGYDAWADQLRPVLTARAASSNVA